LGSAPLPLAGLKKALAPVGPLSVVGLAKLQDLSPKSCDLLVLPYGSAFPEEGWDGIFRYLEKGGNLLVLGGRPFEEPVLSVKGKWVPQGPKTAHHQSLGIEQLNLVPASRMVKLEASPLHPDLEGLQLSPLDSHSLMVRSTEIDEEDRCGAVGPMDSELKPILWGLDAQGTRVSCPAALIDRYQGRFAGGRWVFASAQLPAWNPQVERLVTRLGLLARVGAFQVALRPTLACFQPGAQPGLNLWVRGHERLDRQVQVDLKITLEGERVHSQTLRAQVGRASSYQTLPIPVTVEPGLYQVVAEVSVNGKYSHGLRQAFWGHDASLLRSAPKLEVKGDRFLKDGKPLSVVGTTYMAGDVSRKFLTIPNPHVWDEDMARMAASGVNWVRTGLWANHRQFLLDSGAPREDALCALDAFLLTASKHGLLVTFNFFSFLPDHWPSEHPYLDPRALSVQREFMLSMVRRYAEVPSLSWDFINEPSVCDPARMWKTRPLHGKLESDAFKAFVREGHGDLATLRRRWNMTREELPDWRDISLPTEMDFEEPLAPQNGLTRAGRAYDFNRYGQKVFADWVEGHVKVLREATEQPLCVGQDEGGVSHRRPNNHLFHASLDFTCNHTWWETEDLVSGVTAARVKGKPFLAQETGIMFTDEAGRQKRRSEEEAARLFERKLAASFMGGNGFIQWCWNINQYMNNRNEVQIGAFRADGSARPEGLVLMAFGEFFKKAQDLLGGAPQGASVAVVGSHSGLLSLKSHTAASQKAAHKALVGLGLPFHTLAEHEFDRLTDEKVILFPSVKRIGAQALEGWLKAAKGRVLWVSGPLAQDGWGLPTEGLSSYGVREKRQEVSPFESVRLKAGETSVGFASQNKTTFVDKDGSLVPKVHSFNKHRTPLYYLPVPVEAGDALSPVTALYEELAATCKVKPLFTMEGDGGEVTVLPQVLPQAVLYVAFNEGSTDRKVRVKDSKFGFRTTLDLPAGRVALSVLDPKGRVLASYQGPKF